MCVCVCEAGEGRFSGHPSSCGRAVWHCISGTRARPRCSLCVCTRVCALLCVREKMRSNRGLYGSAIPSQEHCHLATCEEKCLCVCRCVCVILDRSQKIRKLRTETVRNKKTVLLAMNIKESFSCLCVFSSMPVFLMLFFERAFLSQNIIQNARKHQKYSLSHATSPG